MRKEPPRAMDGAVMEGTLFLQSQRFGTKVVGGKRCRTPSEMGGWGATDPRKREEAGRGLERGA